jgi:hypothetical protein
MEIKDALKKLPKGAHAYRKAYDKVVENQIKSQKPGFVELALRTLKWISLAKRPLTTNELQHALAVTQGATALDSRNLRQIGMLISVCAGLVTADEEGNIIRLV